MESLCVAIRGYLAHLTDVGGRCNGAFQPAMVWRVSAAVNGGQGEPSGVTVWPGFLCSIMPPILASDLGFVKPLR